jgi:ABC-type sugar transport system permease subunit/ABC-type glycerol-3-phosphate transport system substrate-binding protein
MLKIVYGFGLTVIVALCIWVVAFSGRGVMDPEVLAKRDNKEVLRLWGGTSEGGVTVIEKINSAISTEFFLEHPEIIPDRSTRLRIPESAADGALLMSLAGGTAPDVLGYSIYQSQTLMEQGFLSSLEPFIAEELERDPSFAERIYIPPKIEPVITRLNTENGKRERYGLVNNYTIKGLLYRKDLFKEAGLDPDRPPKDWDELLSYGLKLTRPGKSVDGAVVKRGQIGLWFHPTDTFMQFAWQNGGDMVRKTKLCPACDKTANVKKEVYIDTCGGCGHDLSAIAEQWQVTWADEPGVKALDFIKSLASTPWIRAEHDGKEREYTFTWEQVEAHETVTFPDGAIFDLSDQATLDAIRKGCLHASTRQHESHTMFARGEIAMIIAPIRDELFIELEDAGLKFDNIRMASLPVCEGGEPIVHMGAGMLGINSQVSEAKQRVAWEYIKFACGAPAWRTRTRILVENGMYFAANPQLLKRFGYDEFYDKVDPSILDFYSAMEETARAMPWGPGWLAVCSSFAPEAVGTVLQPDGYSLDSKETLAKYQLMANQSSMQVKDEAKYRRIRKYAYMVFAVVVVLFGLAIRYVIKTRAAEKTKGLQFDVVGSRSSALARRRHLLALVFLTPAILTVALWKYLPLGWGAGMAFFDYKLLDGFSSQFVGIDNFIDIVHQPMFWKVMGNTLYYVSLTLGLGFIVPIVLALLLDEVPKGKMLFRIIFYIPTIVSPLVTLMLWQLLYEPTEYGLLNQLFIKVGLVDARAPLMFLDSPKLAMLCIIIPSIWAHAGPGCIIYLAALKVVPEDLYEAVAIDGGSIWHKLRAVTLPALAPLIAINFISAFIGSWQAMQNIFVLTGGGPLNATRVIGIEIWYNAFVYLRFGYSTAMAWILAGMLIGFTVMQLRLFSKVEFKTAEGS